MLFCWRAELGRVVMLIIDEEGGAWARALPDILRQLLPTVLAKIAEFKIKNLWRKENAAVNELFPRRKKIIRRR